MFAARQVRHLVDHPKDQWQVLAERGAGLPFDLLQVLLAELPADEQQQLEAAVRGFQEPIATDDALAGQRLEDVAGQVGIDDAAVR